MFVYPVRVEKRFEVGFGELDGVETSSTASWRSTATSDLGADPQFLTGNLQREEEELVESQGQ